MDEAAVGTQVLAHLLEREGELELLEVGVDRARRQGALLAPRQRRLGVLAQPLVVGLRALGGGAHQGAGVAEERAVKGPAPLDEPVVVAKGAIGGESRGDLVPGAEGGGEVRLSGHAAPEILLLGPLARHQVGVEQRRQPVAPHLDAVLHPLDAPLRDAVGLVVRLGVLDHAAAQLRRALDRLRQDGVAQMLELGHGQQPLGRARVTGDEDRLARGRALAPPAQEVGRCGGPAVFVDAQEGHVEAPAGKVEVVRIAAKGRDRGLGNEHHPHVVVALVLVEKVLPAVVEADRLAEEPVVGLGVPAGLLEPRQGLLAGLIGLGLRLAGHGALDLGGDLLDSHQDRDLLGLAAHLFAGGRRQKAGLGERPVGARHLAGAALDAVVVGQHQAVGGDERAAAAAVDPRGRQPRPVEPRLIDLDAVALEHGGGGEVVEGPHALVGGQAGRRGREDGHDDRRENELLHLSTAPGGEERRGSRRPFELCRKGGQRGKAPAGSPRV